jgi:exonuclease SbcD
VVGNVARNAQGDIDLERLLVPLADKSGAAKAWCMAVPFLRPGDVPRLPEGDQGDPYLGGIALLYRQLAALAHARCGDGQAIIAMGHCHMVDGQASLDSERRIVIGGTDALPASMFDDALAYAALGHLHLAQRIGQKEHLRYCGSPLPLSFSEVNYQHQVLRIDLDGCQAREVVPISVPRAVQLLRVPATPAPLPEVLAALEALDLPDAPVQAQPYLEVRVLLDRPEPGLRAQVEAALAGKPVRLAKIEPTRKVATAAPVEDAMTLDQLAQLKPDDVFRRLYQQRFGEEAPPEQLTAFSELLLDCGTEAA